MLDALAFQHTRQQLGFFNGNRTDQNRLSLFVTLGDLFNDCLVLALFCAVDQVCVVDTLYRTVGRNCDNVQLVNFTEFVFLCHCRTGHARQLGVQTEIVLECDGCQGLGFLCDLYAFLCLDCLVQTVIETTSQHLTSGKLVDDDNFAVLDDIVDILPHHAVCFQCLVDMVQQRHVFRIHQIVHSEVLFCFLDTTACDRRCLGLFVYDVIRILVDLFLVLLVVHFYDRCRSQRLCELIHNAVQRSGLVALTGNDKRCSRLVDQDGVHFVYNGKVMFPLYLVLLINDHVVTQIVKSQLIVGAVCNIAVISRTALVVVQTMQDTADCQTQEPQHLAHFIRLCLCQIVVDGNHVYTLARQCIQICSNASHQCFTFTGFHLGNTALVQNDCTNDLYRERLFAQDTISCLTNRRQCLCFHAFQRFAVLQTFPELIGFFFQICVRECLKLLVQFQNLLFQRFDTCQFTSAV